MAAPPTQHHGRQLGSPGAVAARAGRQQPSQ
jgi:hypothetical protein